jgi:hypothetical protein
MRSGNTSGNTGSLPLSPSLDQILPGLGYEIGNVQVLCVQCNMAKGRTRMDEFRDWLRRCYAHQSL